MEKFQLFMPTRYYFGVGEYRRIGQETAKFGKKVLLVSGKGSLKKSGLYGEIVALLQKESIEVFHLDGIDPNPRLATCFQGMEICRQKKIEAVVAVGGGSVLDTAKAVAAGTLDQGDFWDIFLVKRKLTGALPVITIPTLAATGSEYNSTMVIFNEKTGEKFAVGSEHIYPKVSIIDPSLTVSVPRTHTVYGSIDIISHALEPYLSGRGQTPVSDRLAESIFTTVMEATEIVLENPGDLTARGSLMWCSTMALCGIAGVGYGDRHYNAHTIEHELSATLDIAHGAGLAVVLPAVMKHATQNHPAKLAQLAARVFKIEKQWYEEDLTLGLKATEAFKAWCQKLGAPVTLQEIGIKREELTGYAERILRNPKASKLTKEVILEILEDCYE